ncbi:hypothetical protein DW66_1973 [Pseudomonas putida]|nr:hypothetical protein DW66_1973 [Pseudomonas putida]AJG14820.1 hypothetical protein RK21_03312 [Pseudomonas plecoglossicida]
MTWGNRFGHGADHNGGKPQPTTHPRLWNPCRVAIAYRSNQAMELYCRFCWTVPAVTLQVLSQASHGTGLTCA